MNIFATNFKKSGLIAIFLILLLGAFWFGRYVGRASQLADDLSLNYGTDVLADEQAAGFDLSLYWEVWDALKRDHVEKNKIDDKAMFYGSLKGLAASLDDPYTTFMTPEESQEFTADLAGTFEGIGAEIGMRQEVITVIAPLDGTPAHKSGLLAGDQIYAIDNESTIGLTVDEAVKKIRGPKGTDVILTIIRGQEKPRDITITREVIVIKSVTTELRSDGIYIIKVSNFNDDTLELFNQAVNTALLKNPQGIILDLRNNPGGYLDTAVALASEWIDAGPVVAEQFGENKREEYPSNGRARLENYPTVVLINGGSASASEILAGALRDYKKATLIGETTFGKGSVQTLRNLSDGSALKITIAKWLTPAGDFINDKGIEPNIKVEMTQEDFDKDRDPQFDKALEILQK